ncbi:MAG: VWA domain-containing protein [Actinobacteria bacterium]|nr:MAG: VWA domain-containing protein [Actinomycetota bacterium]
MNPWARRVIIALSVWLAAAMASPAAFAAASAPAPAALVVQDVDTSAYPVVRLHVSLPAELHAASGTPAFTLAENGSAVRDVDVEARTTKGEAEPAWVVLVIDTSGSMEGRPMADAKAAAAKLFDGLGADARVAVVAIGDEPRVLTGYTADRAALGSAIDGVYARGETALYDSLMRAAALAPVAASGEPRRSIVLLSDGGDTVSNASFDAAMKALQASGAGLYAVAIESDEYDPQALRLLAAGTGGRLLGVKDTATLSGLFEGIATEIAGGWTLTYTSARPGTKDLEVDITAESGGAAAAAAFAFPNPLFAGEVAGAEPVLPEVGEDPWRLLAVTALAFLSAAALGVGLLLIFVREPNTLAQLKYYDQLHADAGGDAGGMADQVRAKVVGAVGEVAGKRGMLEFVAERLEAAGLPLRPAEYITVHLLAVVGLGMVTELLAGSFALAILVVLVVTALPMVLLANAAERRRMRFEAQLPDVLSMMASSLRGGWGIGQAIGLVVQEAPAPSRDEFRRVDAESRLGMPLERSLQSMADRMRSTDFQAVVTAIAVQREVGGNLAEVLDVVSNTIREREGLRRQISALTADGRISAYILVGLPFVILAILLLVSPDYLEPLYTTLFGSAMLVLGVVLLFVGAVWMWRVTRIEV